jgi:hypothetical protein
LHSRGDTYNSGGEENHSSVTTPFRLHTNYQRSVTEISLYVTRGVVDHTSTAPANQRQIAYSAASPDIADVLREANRERRIRLRLGGLFYLEVGDTSAIWRAHNSECSADFDALFSLLARYPDQPMRFLCAVE